MIYVKVPVVHLEPVHPAAHTQVFGLVQVPPFEQDVDLQHSAETDDNYASKINPLNMGVRYSVP